ncbi:alpha/beta hydrolase [Bifidobacterium asteroides DSM 20089]|uniref:Alpha/beta hydrolase n=1 Tax=Bifidobacterium asteroides DSM 20089 TaxID=1437594 RepID=A0AAD0A8E8_9BIFI|nr:alpha/beta fold hydrolase [Bifidobacterium asteroides]AFU70766.1 putative esterase [Bifidobacterium asteroides PRL2011]ATO40758.1 alpha/beta hydrolase [Bifidobacterium asteroides DSM 20089]ATO42164.1 alpha/beta hydrolase [Bifidobacterium asteroides DSM 20089]
MKLRPIDFEVDDLTLRGTVYECDGGIEKGKKYPTAVLFHGFGGNRVDYAQFIVQMAQSLSQAGLVVITYDRAGHGESDGDFFDTSVSLDVRHAIQVIRQVASLDFVDVKNLHFGGLSLGSVIASIVAAECDFMPRSLVMCSSAAVFVDEIADGKIQGMPIDDLKTKGYFDFNGMKMGPAMVEDASSIDVYARAARYSGNVLLMHGTKDFVPLSYAERYKDLFGDKARLLVREGADHGWSSVPDREFVMGNAAEFMAHCAGLR